MIYSKIITTTKSTTQTEPLKTELQVTTGLVYKVQLIFPTGSAGLMGVCIFDGSFQLWPSNVGSWFLGDGIIIGFDDIYLKESKPNILTIYTYNDDDTYDHKVIVNIGLVSKKIFMARFLPHLAYEYYEQMLTTLKEQQALQAESQKQLTLETPIPFV